MIVNADCLVYSTAKGAEQRPFAVYDTGDQALENCPNGKHSRNF